MKENKYGRIINIASAHGLTASEYKSAYVASKHGIIGLTKVLALEGAPFGITCNAICPGYVKTPLVEKQIVDQTNNPKKGYRGICGFHFQYSTKAYHTGSGRVN